MKLSLTPSLIDVVRRTLKTFVAAFATAFVIPHSFGLSVWKSALWAGTSAGITAVWNVLLNAKPNAPTTAGPIDTTQLG